MTNKPEKIDLGEIDIEVEESKIKSSYGLLVRGIATNDVSNPTKFFLLGALDTEGKLKIIKDSIQILRIYGISESSELKGKYKTADIFDSNYATNPFQLNKTLMRYAKVDKYPYIKVVFTMDNDFENRQELFSKNHFCTNE
jgi:hypothetical protein